MTAVSRSAQFAKVHKVLKKSYRPASAVGRTVMEHLLFACCLEDAHHDAAEEAFAALVHTFFDWNEVRVTSISELSEVMACLPDPRAAANRIKRILHAVFEATFKFDLEECLKKNLGPTVTWLEKLDGTTRFTIAYVVQAALGGHAIPIDTGTMNVLHVLGQVTDKDVSAGVVPGLERAVAKSKGVEFGSLLHEFGADFSANPYAASLRDLFLQIEPECANRLPKRRVIRAERKAAEPEKPAKGDKEKDSAATKQAAAKEPAKEHESKTAAKTPPKVAPAKKHPAAESVAHESPKKKPAAPEPAKKPAEKSLPKPAKKPNASEGTLKRKPR